MGDGILDGVKDNFNYDDTGDDDYEKVNDHSNDDDVINIDTVKIVKASNRQGSSIVLNER